MRTPGNGTAAGEAGGGGHDSIGLVRARLALMLGGSAVAFAGVVGYRLVRRRPAPAPAADEHAAELRAKLAESRVVVDDREEFESAETPVDLAKEVVAPDLGNRRRAVHDRGRHVAEEMRRGAND